MSEYYAIVYSNSLSHHGVKGMKWGVRKQRIVAGARRIGAAAKPVLQREIKERNRKYRNKKGHLSIGKFALRGVGRVAKTGLAMGAGGVGTAVLIGTGHPAAAKVLAYAAGVYVTSLKYQKYADYGAVAYQSMKNIGAVAAAKRTANKVYDTYTRARKSR